MLNYKIDHNNLDHLYRLTSSTFDSMTTTDEDKRDALFRFFHAHNISHFTMCNIHLLRSTEIS